MLSRKESLNTSKTIQKSKSNNIKKLLTDIDKLALIRTVITICSLAVQTFTLLHILGH